MIAPKLNKLTTGVVMALALTAGAATACSSDGHVSAGSAGDTAPELPKFADVAPNSTLGMVIVNKDGSPQPQLITVQDSNIAMVGKDGVLEQAPFDPMMTIPMTHPPVDFRTEFEPQLPTFMKEYAAAVQQCGDSPVGFSVSLTPTGAWYRAATCDNDASTMVLSRLGDSDVDTDVAVMSTAGLAALAPAVSAAFVDGAFSHITMSVLEDSADPKAIAMDAPAPPSDLTVYGKPFEYAGVSYTPMLYLPAPNRPLDVGVAVRTERLQELSMSDAPASFAPFTPATMGFVDAYVAQHRKMVEQARATADDPTAEGVEKQNAENNAAKAAPYPDVIDAAVTDHNTIKVLIGGEEYPL